MVKLCKTTIDIFDDAQASENISKKDSAPESTVAIIENGLILKIKMDKLKTELKIEHCTIKA